MRWLVCFDIADPRRLRRVARQLERVGERQQDSVFIVNLDAPSLQRLQRQLAALADHAVDNVRMYPLPVAPGGAPGYWIV